MEMEHTSNIHKLIFHSRNRMLVVQFILILLTLPIWALADPLDDLKSQTGPKALSGTSFDKAAIALSSGYVEVAVAANGNFTMGTLLGDPDNSLDDNKRILYGHPDPGTGASTLRVDNQDYWNFGAGGSQLPLPVSGPTTSGQSNLTVWQVGDIKFTQHLKLTAGDSGRLDTLCMEYTAYNQGSQSHEVGIRLFLDTQLGSNDGAPFRVPGAGYVITEQELLGMAVPQSYLSFDRLLHPSIQTQGTLTGGTSVTPDRVVWGNWTHLNDTPFDCTIDPRLSLLGDSAVALYWNPTPLAAGQTRRVATYYGLGDIEVNEGALTVGLYGPAQLSLENGLYAPNPFTVTTFVSNPANVKDVTSEEVQAELLLPEGLALNPGETAVHNLGPIAVGVTTQTTWQVLAEASGGQDLTYSVQVTKTGIDPLLVSRTIHLPTAEVTLHPGFEEGVPLGKGLVQSSLGIADIDQDRLDEIVVGGADGSLYGYNGDGSAVVENLENPGALFTGMAGIYSTPTLADVDLDKRVDLLFGNDAGVVYHLELRLSSDSTKIIKESLSLPPVLLPKAMPKAAPAKGEEDDTGR